MIVRICRGKQRIVSDCVTKLIDGIYLANKCCILSSMLVSQITVGDIKGSTKCHSILANKVDRI